METYFWFLSITFFNQNLAWGTLKVCFTTLLKYIEVTKINCTLSKNAVLFCRALALCFSFFFFPVCLWMFDKAQPQWTINFWKPLNKPTHVKDWEMHTLLVAAVRLSWNWWGHPRAYSKHVLIYFLAENHLKTITTNKDASEDQYCYFFHPSTSKFFISLNWANVVLQGRNK